MDWLARTPERRAAPERLWPAAQSAIVCAMSYGPGTDPLPELGRRSRGYLSVYARNRDYHDVLKGRLKQLGQWLHRRSGAGVKVFVDTAPLLEKPLAEAAGVGWQGKHTNLVSRRHGSWLFLGEILTDLDLPPDEAESDHCGRCRRCLDVCPTDAFPAPYQLDARRCISYLTIEHRGQIPRRAARRHGQPDLWLRRLPRGLPLEQVRPGGERGEAPGPRRPRDPRPRRAGGTRRCRLSAAVRRLAGQAGRPRPLRPQRPGRDRQQRRRGPGTGRRSEARRPLAAGPRHGRLGARPAAPAERLREIAGSRSEADVEVRAEWRAAGIA